MHVWIWEYCCDGDQSYTVYGTEQAALDAVYGYVVDNWDNAVPDEPMPEGRNDAINRYFEAQQDIEWYEISRRKVSHLPDLPPPENAVEMSPEELRLCVEGLRNLQYGQAAGVLDVPPLEAADVIESAIKKLE